MNPYSYTANPDRAEMLLTAKTRHYQRFAVSFASARTTEYPEMNTVSGDYYQPRGVKTAPLAVLLHGATDPSIVPCRLLARRLARQGIAAFVLYMTLDSRRMPAAMLGRFPVLSDDEWFEHYILSVTDVRQVVDWASGRPEVDNNNIAVIGISVGGFIAAIAMAVDWRIRAGVLLLAGGNSEKIALKSRAVRKKYKGTPDKSGGRQVKYKAYLAQVAENGFENVNPPKRSFLIDPLTFAPLLHSRPLMMINARWDEVVPREATLELWQAAGRPPLSWLPATHASIWLYYPWISRRITGFLLSSPVTKESRRS